MSAVLIICVGNVARGDDGVGHEVARRLESLPDGAALLVETSLDVTHAAAVAEAERLIVVDAHRRDEPPVETWRVESGTTPVGTHGLTVEALQGLAATLYGHAPEAWLVTVAAPQMGHGETLSETAERAAEAAAAEVLRLVADGPVAD
jgi:hydrogenase maturation protease